MNKKFSTLLASVLLVGSVSANAQVNADQVSKLEKGFYALNASGTAVTTTNGSTVVGKNLQVVDGKLKVANDLTSDYNNALWTITASATNSNHFTLVNKATGLAITFDPKTAVFGGKDGKVTTPATGQLLTGQSMAWGWVANSYSDELEAPKALTYALSVDSTMALATATDGTVFAYKYANAKPATGVTALTIQATKPTTVAMTKDDLNVLDGGTNGLYFTLTPKKKDLKVDMISGVKFQAEDITGGYVALKELGTKKYLRVDTAVHVATGLNKDNLYQLARKELKTGETTAASVPNHFKIVKDLFKDSVFVSIKQDGSRFTYDEAGNATGSQWATAMVLTGTPHAAADYCTLSSILLTPTTEVMTFFKPATPTSATLVEENLLFAVSDPATASDYKTSVADGLYYIKNSKGQYLASPIYNNGDDAKWVTVDANEQSVANMPAYQWVVLKNNTLSYFADKSSVEIINREFEGLNANAIQLYKNEGATYYYTAAAFDDLVATDSLVFEQITDKAVLGNENLGYKKLTPNELKVNRYTFNYFNPYVSDKYIGKSTDSLLVVMDNIIPFELTAGDEEAYGYTVPAKGNRIADLKQLKRQSYTMVSPSAKGNLKFGQNVEHKYVISKENDITATPFYFKENNYAKRASDDAKNSFYALVTFDVNASTADDINGKAGVADETLDATLKQQVISEVRTSSFLVAPYGAPLYRRFNSKVLEGNEETPDAPDTLRFVEKYRKEYLQVEANENFKVDGIKFLGVYTPDFTKDGKSFIVDTAFVNRWNGAIKPQYLISINRMDQAFEPGEMCPVCKEIVANGGTRPVNCPHDKAGKAPFHMGEYLVNFADSVNNAANKADYAWKGYTRAGFVKAAHMGDSLFILTGRFADVTLATFDTAVIKQAVKDKKYAEKYIVNLQKDNHKAVTWSMRFVDPEKAAKENEEDRAFLMESQKAEGDKDIAPTKGQWLKMQNGCIVLSGSLDGSESSFDQITGADDALIFNVEQGNKEDIATENEAISTSAVTVIAGNGDITIKGAANKTVTISNVLGQTIASTVLSSDEATISAPAGIVVVAVEGEAAVKAIVK